MKLIFQTKENEAIRIDIGFETPFHSCLYWFSITKEYYEEGEIVYVKWIWAFFKDPKFWFK